MNREVHYVGELAYFDGITGLTACKVISVRSYKDISIQVTTNRTPGYKIGDLITTSGIWVIPRKYVKKRKYGHFVSPILYEWSK